MSSPFALVPHWPGMPHAVAALTTTRCHGVSPAPYDDGQGGGGFNLGLHVGDDPENVRRNRAHLRHVLPAEPAWISQVHGIAVVDAAQVTTDAPVVADASVTGQRGVVCAIQTADCIPVLLADKDGKVVGAAHAGWRSLSGGVLAATVAAMRAKGAGGITAWIGPSIGPDKFEVGEDVLQAFLATALADAGQVRACFRPIPGKSGKFHANMWGLARLALARDGVTDVAFSEHCTVSEPETFYSYRRDGVTGRMATLIWLR